MAYVKNYNPDDDTTDTGGAIAGSDPMLTNTSIGTTTTSDAMSKTTQKPQSSGTFTNLQKYLNANVAGAGQLGQRVAGDITSTGQQAEQAIAGGTTAEAQQGLTRAIEKQNLAGTVGGRTQLLKNAAPETSVGGLNLNQFLLQNTQPAFGQVEQAAQSITPLMGQFSQRTAREQRVTPSQAPTPSARSQALATLSGETAARPMTPAPFESAPSDSFTQPIVNQQQDYQRQLNEQMAQYQQANQQQQQAYQQANQQQQQAYQSPYQNQIAQQQAADIAANQQAEATNQQQLAAFLANQQAQEQAARQGQISFEQQLAELFRPQPVGPAVPAPVAPAPVANIGTPVTELGGGPGDSVGTGAGGISGGVSTGQVGAGLGLAGVALGVPGLSTIGTNLGLAQAIADAINAQIGEANQATVAAQMGLTPSEAATPEGIAAAAAGIDATPIGNENIGQTATPGPSGTGGAAAGAGAAAAAAASALGHSDAAIGAAAQAAADAAVSGQNAAAAAAAGAAAASAADGVSGTGISGFGSIGEGIGESIGAGIGGFGGVSVGEGMGAAGGTGIGIGSVGSVGEGMGAAGGSGISGVGGIGEGIGAGLGSIGSVGEGIGSVGEGIGSVGSVGSVGDAPGSVGSAGGEGPAGEGAGSGGGGGKIICTAMNDMYGLPYRENRVWIKYSATHMTPEHQTGYHRVFLPLVDFAFKSGNGLLNRIVRKSLIWIAVNRTQDIEDELAGRNPRYIKRALIRRPAERLIYLIGKWSKK
jgi:hypothetical protein